MPGLMTYRTLASASRSGNRATGTNAQVWTKSGKKLEEGPQFPTRPKAGRVVPPQTPACPASSQARLKHSTNLQKKTDLFSEVKQARMYGDAVNADRRSHLSSGSCASEHELSSICLAEMVHDFMEDEPSQLCRCGRARCNCEIGNANSSDVCFSASPDASKPAYGSAEHLETLKGLVSGMSAIEYALLGRVNEAVAAVKEQGVDLCEEDVECTNRCFKRCIVKYLRAANYNAAVCESRLEHAVGFTGGQYEYMDVIEICNGTPQRLIVDIQFRAQFEIARPTDQYSALLQELPAVFVGDSSRLSQIVNIMCDAMKRSLKKTGMHLPPWRKLEYMKSKWFSTYKRSTTGQQVCDNCDNILNHDSQKEEPAVQDLLGVHNFGNMPTKSSVKPFEPEPAQALADIGSNWRFNGRDTSVSMTDWQPPLVTDRLTNKTTKLAGLASALMEAGLTTLMEHNAAMNYENNFGMPAKRAVKAA